MTSPTTPDNKQQETPKLFVDAGITFTGSIRFDGKPTDLAVIKGKVIADIEWPGRLMVCEGGEVVVKSTATIRDLHVAGKLTGESPDARVEAGIVRAAATAYVELGTLSLPPGGLEQARGAVLNASLRMSADHVFASVEDPAATSRPLVVVSNTRLGNPSAEGQAAAVGQAFPAQSGRSVG